MTSLGGPVSVMRPAREPSRWLPPLVQGMLWGVAVSVMESVRLPVRDGSASAFSLVMIWITPGWCIVGIGIAFLVERVGASIVRPQLAVACAIACAAIFSGLWSWIYSREWVRGLHSGLSTVFPHEVDAFAAFAYQTWIVLFYGGLYFVAWRLNHRAEQERRSIGQTEIARIRTEILRGEARLRFLRDQFQPQLLLRVLTEVERRYAQAPAGADRLLDLLVAFLRVTMPALRGEDSALAVERERARARGQLRAELESDPAAGGGFDVVDAHDARVPDRGASP